ncbi:MAG: hypothetical protein IIY15_02190, partial [Flavobacteriales bacterium]|nr:hypothetical protein [Flavobacteriales bacterium]
ISYTNEYHNFSTAIDAAVIYKSHTPYMFDIPINIFSGISTYIPLPSSPQRNRCYQNTEWYRDTYL